MRGLNLLGLVAALVIVAFVAKRQWTATRLPAVAPAPASAPAAEPASSRQRTEADVVGDVRSATDALMQQRPQQLRDLERNVSEPQ